MQELVFTGLGLNDENGLSLTGLEEAKSADTVFAELYTNLLPNLSIDNLENLIDKKITLLKRRDLEDQNGETLIQAAKKGKTVLFVPGDPLIATTHITLRLAAQKANIKTRIVHGASIISAAIGLAGLHNYKFGKSVTIPFPDNYSETPYTVIDQNRKAGLHTLCLLDIDTEQEHYLTIRDSIEALLKIEQKRKQKAFTQTSLAVGIARAGSKTPAVRADYARKLLDQDFGAPPYCLIVPAGLHFMEAEALIAFAGAPLDLKEKTT
jgi:diphthine synthase